MSESASLLGGLLCCVPVETDLHRNFLHPIGALNFAFHFRRQGPPSSNLSLETLDCFEDLGRWSLRWRAPDSGAQICHRCHEHRK